MTGYERISNLLRHQRTDRIGFNEHFWSDTQKAYTQQGHLRPDESVETHFGFDMSEYWSFNMTADLDFERKVVNETEDTITYLDGNGATLRRHKFHDTTPEHVGFCVTDGESWKKYREFFSVVDERRIDFEGYRRARQEARDNGRFFVWSGVNVFECMHPVCGHENMLAGMLLEPEWILDMANTYAEQTIALQQILFEQEGKPDGIWYYEDMGYKLKPFLSPQLYREMLMPFHKRTFDFAKAEGLPVILHSCGFIEPLLPSLIEAGIDCLQAMEVKAGMDLLRIYRAYGERIALMGGIDVRALYSNDKAIIDYELESKIPLVKEGYGYILHSDHSIPKEVQCETFEYFIQKGLELGRYK